jgi:UDP-glucose 4-epimerase
MILVTGGCGYIGSHTLIELYENNIPFISIDDLRRSSKTQVDNISKLIPSFINYKVDICDLDSLEKIFIDNEIMGIIHFAAYKSVDESVKNPLIYYDNNINSLLNLLKCCKKFNVKNFIFSSSCSVYGNLKDLPVTEESLLSKAESPYGNTKQICEDILGDYSKNSNMNIVILRYFNPVGCHESGLIGDQHKESVINMICKSYKESRVFNIYGNDYNTKDGTCIRDYIHVSDLAAAHVSSLIYLKDKNNQFDIFNVGTGNGLSVLELLLNFEKYNNLKINYQFNSRRPGDVEAIWANVDKISKTGWTCNKSIKDMVTSTWNYVKSSE